VRVTDRLAAVAAVDEMLFHAAARRARPHQRNRLDDRVAGVRLQLAQQPAHGGRLDLKAADGVAGAEQCCRGGVRVGNGLDVEARVTPGSDSGDRVMDGAQGAVAQQVHLDQAELLDGVLVELGDDDAPGGPFQRHIAREWFRRNDQTAGVGRQVVRQPGDGLAEVNDALERFLIQPQAAAFRHRPQQQAQVFRPVMGENPRNRPDFTFREPERLGRLAHCRPRLKRINRADHGDPVGAVPFVDIVEYLVAAAPAQVEINVGGVPARPVQKTLEVQLVPERVRTGDAQRVGDKAVRRRAPSHRRDVPRLREADNVGHNQEIGGETQFGNHVQFMMGAVENLRR